MSREWLRGERGVALGIVAQGCKLWSFVLIVGVLC
jgi:hypothetical protein